MRRRFRGGGWGSSAPPRSLPEFATPGEDILRKFVLQGIEYSPRTHNVQWKENFSWLGKLKQQRRLSAEPIYACSSIPSIFPDFRGDSGDSLPVGRKTTKSAPNNLAWMDRFVHRESGRPSKILA